MTIAFGTHIIVELPTIVASKLIYNSASLALSPSAILPPPGEQVWELNTVGYGMTPLARITSTGTSDWKVSITVVALP